MKNHLKISLAVLTALAAGMIGFAQPVHAEDEETYVPENYLQISPARGIVTLEGGKTLEGKAERCPQTSDGYCRIEVKNVGTKAFRFRVYVSPYVVTGENYDLNFSEDASTSYTQISRWITFRDQSGEYVKEIIGQLNPGETQVIDYRIEVPEDVPGGSQYAAIWAQTINNDATTGTGVQAVAQAGMVLAGRSIGDTTETADVTEYDFTRFTLGGALHANATIKNTGNTDFDAYYSYEAKTIFGKKLFEDNGSIATYPDTEYHINVDWEEPPLLGIFQVEFRVSGANTVKTEKHLVVIMPIFVMILLILLLTVVIVWIIIITRKRKERKTRTLV